MSRYHPKSKFLCHQIFTAWITAQIPPANRPIEAVTPNIANASGSMMICLICTVAAGSSINMVTIKNSRINAAPATYKSTSRATSRQKNSREND